VGFIGTERSDEWPSELGKLPYVLVATTPILESAGFGFESRGAHFKISPKSATGFTEAGDPGAASQAGRCDAAADLGVSRLGSGVSASRNKGGAGSSCWRPVRRVSNLGYPGAVGTSGTGCSDG
jgi:hypothetical protein